MQILLDNCIIYSWIYEFTITRYNYLFINVNMLKYECFGFSGALIFMVHGDAQTMNQILI